MLWPILHCKPCLLTGSHACPVQDKGMHGAERGAPLLLVRLWLLLVGKGQVEYTTPLCPRPHVVGTKGGGGW